MKSKTLGLVILIAAAIVAVFAIYWKKISGLAVKRVSDTFDPRTWNISAEETALINTLTKAEQDDIAMKWKQAMALNQNQSGEAVYHLLLAAAKLEHP